jgi:Cof subfamily protein (haloacid dehalogenase superfamily)
MYKMITIDVDDTLLNDQHIVTEGTKHALTEAVNRGVVVTLATGRMYASAKQIASQIKLNVPLITYQGSLVKNLLDEKVIYERSVPNAIASTLFDYAEKHGFHLQTYYNDQLVATEENEKLRNYSNVSKVPFFVRSKADILKHAQTKLLFFEEPEVLDQIAKDLDKLMGNEVHITKSKPYFLEIVHKEATKGHAVSFLADYYGCSLEQVIAIGDSWNDREMIEIAGLGVAMGNAVPSLKEIANYVTKTNNEDGVKHVIEKFVLNDSTSHRES